MSRMIPLAAVAAAAALAPAAAQAGGGPTQYVGDPLTYLRVGRPATSLTTAFRLNQPLAAGASIAAQTAGGTVLDTATPKLLGSSGLCYSATFSLPSAVSPGGTLTLVLTTAGGQSLAPNPELIGLFTARKQRNVAAMVGAGSC